MKFITGVLVGTLLGLVTYIGAVELRKHQNSEQPIQVYAGEGIEETVAAATAPRPPSLYVCKIPTETYYLIIADSKEFMAFDGTGVFVNNGQFFDAKTDQGVGYLHSEVGGVLLGFYKKDDGWHLAISTTEGITDYNCE
jgi:hypothetical protein